MKFLIKNKEVLIDKKDYERVRKYHWIISVKGYAVRKVKTADTFRKGEYREFLHRFILGLKKGDGIEIDHKNRNKLDNRRNNLRICTRSDNRCNTGLRSDTISGFKGVCWDNNKKKWFVQINKKGIRICGCFDSKIEAAKFYNKVAKKLHGKFAYLNPVS